MDKLKSGIKGPGEPNRTCIVCNTNPGKEIDNEYGPIYFPGTFKLLPRNPNLCTECIGEHYTERSHVYV